MINISEVALKSIDQGQNRQFSHVSLNYISYNFATRFDYTYNYSYIKAVFIILATL